MLGIIVIFYFREIFYGVPVHFDFLSKIFKKYEIKVANRKFRGHYNMTG
jgi:hypothetical protein